MFIFGKHQTLESIVCVLTVQSIIFRWFKFTLKPPYTVVHGHLLSALWSTFG